MEKLASTPARPILALAALGLLLGRAHAAEPPTLTDTVWVQKAPGFADVVAAYPPAARAKGLAGEATLDCAFDAAGRLNHCQTINERPMGSGFAKAAIGLAGRFEGRAHLPNGHSIAGARAQVRIRFAPDMLNGSTVLNPEWAALPTPAQFQGAFPEAAAKAGVLQARAAMSCTVEADGGLAACTAASEEPAGYGFGAATLPLAPLFRVKLWGADGRPVVGGVVRVPIRYDLTQAKPAKP